MNDEDCYESPESMISCPINPAHTMLKSRLSTHLVKCEKQHPDLAKKLKTCPFNSNHRIPPTELPYHESVCPDRENFYNFAFRTEDRPNRAVDELVNNSRIPIEIESTENWDDEINEDQNILSVIQNSKKDIAYQNFSNLPRSERKAKRNEHRVRDRERLNAEDNNFPSSRQSVGSSSIASIRSTYSGALPNHKISGSTHGGGRNTQIKTSKDIGFGRGRKP